MQEQTEFKKFQRLHKSFFRNIYKKDIKILLEEEVFSNEQFIEQVKYVSLKTNIDEKIVKEVLTSYFTNILIVINSIRKVTTKINVYGFFSLIIRKGRNT